MWFDCGTFVCSPICCVKKDPGLCLILVGGCDLRFGMVCGGGYL